MKVGMISLGCPKNLSDTEAILGLLVDAGYELTNDQNKADIMIVNTCAFLGEARDEAFGIIKEMTMLKSKGSLKYLVVAGCLPKRDKNGLFDSCPAIDAIVGPGRVDQIVRVLKSLGSRKRISLIEGTHCLFTHRTPRLKATPKHWAYIKISDGCNNRCSYCVVPSLRGKYRSRPMGSIVAEVRSLVRKGLKEAILIAQDTTLYGTDIYRKPSLHILCKKLAGIPGLKWIRIMYAHPAHVTDKLIETMAKERKIVRYLDLPIQHACDTILSKMRRRISAFELKGLVHKLRRKIPGIAIRTSMIVGFPGETDKDFNELISFVKKGRFERLGVFRYSREKGTSAAEMRGQISERVKGSRFRRLMSLQREISRESLKKMVGKIIDVLSDGMTGRSYMDAPEIDGVVKLNKNVPIGKIAKIRITGSGDYDLSGSVFT